MKTFCTSGEKNNDNKKQITIEEALRGFFEYTLKEYLDGLKDNRAHHLKRYICELEERVYSLEVDRIWIMDDLGRKPVPKLEEIREKILKNLGIVKEDMDKWLGEIKTKEYF